VFTNCFATVQSSPNHCVRTFKLVLRRTLEIAMPQRRLVGAEQPLSRGGERPVFASTSEVYPRSRRDLWESVGSVPTMHKAALVFSRGFEVIDRAPPSGRGVSGFTGQECGSFAGQGNKATPLGCKKARVSLFWILFRVPPSPHKSCCVSNSRIELSGLTMLSASGE
jgi:hypothetical protein